MNFLAVGLGGFLGAVLRYSVDLLPFCRDGFPVKTLCVNVIGSFALGLLYAAAAHKDFSPVLLLFLGTGLCGGFTTFSTFAVQSCRLLAADLPLAAAYALTSLVLGVGAVFCAGWLVR